MADDINIDEQDDGSALVDMPEMNTEEQPDGSAIIEMDDGPEFNPQRGVVMMGANRVLLLHPIVLLNDAVP